LTVLSLPRLPATRHRVRRVVGAATRRGLIGLRRRYYCDGSAQAVRHLPGEWRARLGLDDESARGTRRIELGAGPYPHPGYVHVDADPHAAHLEARALAWQLPFPDGWASELLSIHTLEHIHPRRLQETLREWHRVLRPGGVVRVHVPNSPSLMAAYLNAQRPADKWMVSGALLGMYCGPEVQGPADIPAAADHQILFDMELLLAVLGEAGFVDLRDLTSQVVDRHTEPWQHVVDRCSLVIEGRKPGREAVDALG